MRVSTEGILDYGTVVFAENPTTLLEAGDFHSYKFDGRAGVVVTIAMTSTSCGAPDTILDLFGPQDANGNRGASLVESDDAYLGPCFLDSQITNFTLPVSGTYLIVATSYLQQSGGHYKLQLTCNNNACSLPGSETFASTRINQSDIDHGVFTPGALFDIGSFMFKTVYRVEDGLGNGLAGVPGGGKPPPSFRQIPNNVHFASFGAPEAQSCVTCHNVGGDGGGGDLNHNIFQMGDGINRASGVPRNPPAVLGNGLRQRIGEEMTADLAAELAAAKAQAASTGVAVTKALTTKGISFGSLVANTNGTVNTAGVVGVDADLIVKPFGWKGREATIRRFIEDSFRVHFGLQTQPSIVKHCATPNVNTFGNGPNCQDPDGDGVTNEITEGQLSAEAVYMGLRETPFRDPVTSGQACSNSVDAGGEMLFYNIGCASCHVRNTKINVPVLVERADTTGGAGITLNLATDTHYPHPAINPDDGSMTVEVFSDFKRHDVGVALADSKDFKQIPANQFITPPLWGVADSAPYLHDGRAPTLNNAILMHAGDALAVRNAYAALSTADRGQILSFLGTLRRTNNVSATTFQSTSSQSTVAQLEPTSLVNSDQCPPYMCGMNGVWLGGGVPFRTLNLDLNGVNERNFRIVDFRSGSGELLVPDVDNDSLIGRKPNGNLSGAALIGSTLTLEKLPGGAVAAVAISDLIYLTIIDFHLRQFLADCIAPYQCGDKQASVYTFIAKTNHSDCLLEMCQPGLNPDDSRLPALAGDAVIFQGDLYDESTYQVYPVPTHNPTGIVNIACLGTAISKLHLLRHTSASQSANIPGPLQPDRLKRQALLQLLTGNYCGSNQLFTRNGIPIKIGFNGSPYQPTVDSKFRIGVDVNGNPEVDSIDAQWDSTGATYIGTPRLGPSVLQEIKDACAAVKHPFIASNGYATSANPPQSTSANPPQSQWSGSATPNLTTIDNGTACTNLTVTTGGYSSTFAKLDISGSHDFRSILRGTLTHNNITVDAFPVRTFPDYSGAFSLTSRAVPGLSGDSSGIWTFCIIDTDPYGDTGVLNTWSVHN